MAEQIVLGLSAAALYSLFAAGLTLVFGVLDILNMAHAAVYMWGAFIAWDAAVNYGVPLLLAIVLAIIGASIIGVLLEFLIFRPLRKRDAPGLMALVAALAAGGLLVSIAELRFGTQIFAFPSGDFTQGELSIGPLHGPTSAFLIIGVAVVVVGGLWWAIVNTRAGSALRAIEEDAAVAELMGIAVDRMIAATFAIASAMAAIAGIAVGLVFANISPFMGSELEVKAFTIIILGGMGSVPGAILGALAVATMETVAVIAGLSGYSPLIVLLTVVVLLMVRPQGILGRSVREA
jgi:branched-chain amino acid transport system permease protein